MHAPSSWHHGLVADYRAAVNLDAELDLYRQYLQSPVLDAGCGSGRLLAPLRERGFDVDGCDVSADMIDCRQRVPDATLWVSALHELNPLRRYASILCSGVLGLGSTRASRPSSSTFALSILVTFMAVSPVAAGPSAAPVYRVDHVVDGDTIALRNGQRVRLVQVDTPEVYFGVECYGRAASRTTKALLPVGSRVRLFDEPATDRVDQYGRLLVTSYASTARST